MSSSNSVKENHDRLIANNSQQNNSNLRPLPPREEAIQNGVINIFKMMAYGEDYIQNLELIQDQGSFVLQFVPRGYLNSEKTPLFNHYLRAVESTIKKHDESGYIKTEICEEEKNKTQYTILKLRINPEYKNVSVNEINLIFFSKKELESSLNENINNEVRKDPSFEGRSPHLAIKALHRIEQGISNALNKLNFPLNIERKILQDGTRMGITYCLRPLNPRLLSFREVTRIECAMNAMEATFRDKLGAGKATYTVQGKNTFSIDISSNLTGFKSGAFEKELGQYFCNAYRWFFEKRTGKKDPSIPAIESPSDDVHDAVGNRKRKENVDVFIKNNIDKNEKERIQNVFDQILIDVNYVCALSRKEVLHDACFVEEEPNEQNKMPCIHYFNFDELQQWRASEMHKDPTASWIEHPVTGVPSIKADGSNIKKSPAMNKQVAQYLENAEKFLQEAHSQQISSESKIKKYLDGSNIEKCLEKPLIWLTTKVTTSVTVEVGKVVGAKIGEAIGSEVGGIIGKEIGGQVGKAVGPGFGGMVGNSLVSLVSSGISRFSSWFFAPPPIDLDKLPKPDPKEELPGPKEELIVSKNNSDKTKHEQIFDHWAKEQFYIAKVRCVILDPWNYKSNSLNSAVNIDTWRGAFKAAIQFADRVVIQNGHFIMIKSIHECNILYQKDICILCLGKKRNGFDHLDDIKQMWDLSVDKNKINDFAIKVLKFCNEKKYASEDKTDLQYTQDLIKFSKEMETMKKPFYDHDGERIIFNNHTELDTFITENSSLEWTDPFGWAKLIAFDRIFNLSEPRNECPKKPNIKMSMPMQM